MKRKEEEDERLQEDIFPIASQEINGGCWDDAMQHNAEQAHPKQPKRVDGVNDLATAVHVVIFVDDRPVRGLVKGMRDEGPVHLLVLPDQSRP